MKAVSMYSPYGYKAKIGLITPSSNTINEPDWWRMAPQGVTIHTSRVLLTGKADIESYGRMADSLDRAAEELATTEPDVVAYGCTSGSFMCPMPQLLDKIRTRTGTPVTATAGAVAAALRALGVRRIAMGTPYVDFVNQAEVGFFQSYGFDVVSLHGLNLGETQEERRGIGRVPPEVVYRMARLIDRDDAEAIFISCTNLATLDVIADIEKDLGKPVVTSNQACFWACLRLIDLRVPVTGYGVLLEKFLDPIEESAFAVGQPRLVSV
jgi:arylmalonate decarboxylase